MSERDSEVKRLTLQPDEHMRWIYDYTHPDYNSDRAKDLRERRAAALRNCPAWMLWEAQLNDAMNALTSTKSVR